MADLSAITALLDDKNFKRDLSIVTMRFPAWSQYECLTFTLAVHRYVLLSTFAGEEDDTKEGDPGWVDPDDSDDTRWKP
jgi:hypothetical protein